MNDTSEQLRAAMEAGYQQVRAAFPTADQVSLTTSVYSGTLQVYASARFGAAWFSSIAHETVDIDGAINALRKKVGDTAALRAEAAALIARADKLEGRA
jgi:hypothetical protein